MISKKLLYVAALAWLLPACDDTGEGATDATADVPLCLADPRAPGCAEDVGAPDATPTPACRDGVDNDGDGRTDYPDDPGCLDPDGPVEFGEPDPAACEDGLDNDEDGYIDYPYDPGCASPKDSDEIDEQVQTRPCADGRDNDRDGLVDLEDPGCPYADGPREQDPEVPPACSNGLDDDGDGLIDFPLELGCSAAGDDDETDPAFELACANGLDDDRDGRVDYPFDPGCLSLGDNDERDPSPLPACSDGVDNDRDGRIDYPEDLGCASAGGYDERIRCDGTPVVELGGVEARGDTRGARFESEGSCGGAGASELVFHYRLEEEVEALIVSTDHPETELVTALYVRAACATPDTERACAIGDTQTPGATARVESPAIGDYFIFVDGAASNGGAFKLTIEAEALPACRNDVDDDEDGLTDYPFDPGCATTEGDDETDPDPLPACADGIDNDGDARVDFPLDQGCAMAADDDELDLCGQGVRFEAFPEGGRVEGRIGGGQGDARGSCGGLNYPERIFEYANPINARLTFRLEADPTGGQALYVRSTCARADTELGCGFGRGDEAQPEVIIERANPGSYFVFVDKRLDNASDEFALQIIAERLLPGCRDGRDNDEDGFIDGEDLGCEGPDDEREEFEGGDPVCADGLDNDEDGLADYPWDPGCATLGDPDEQDPDEPPACDNGVDDDGDGFTDYPEDAGCAARGDVAEERAVLSECDNGLDDDGDGLIDHPRDPGCAAPGDLSEADPLRLPECANGEDDDGSGEADYPWDPGCDAAGDPLEAPEAVTPACGDGLDNDEDGLIDFPWEPGCASAADDDEADPAFLPACANNRDDDSNGRVDFPDDPGCFAASDTEERWQGRLPPRCADAHDNDGDGFTDLEDIGCANPRDDDEADPILKPRCADGEDNDGDGRTDYPDDPGCEGQGDACESWGHGLCGEVCEDLMTDPTHCGACGRACDEGVECIEGFCGGLFTFEGILQGVEEAELGGWRTCASSNYAEMYSIQRALDDCDGRYIMYGCRPMGASSFTLLAMGEREFVFRDTGDRGNALTPHNGVEWYFSQSYSMGFVSPGTGVQRNSCDTGALAPHLRMCWHTQGGQISSGYRCGESFLNGARNWERVIFTAD